jgi:hypothetical protein
MWKEKRKCSQEGRGQDQDQMIVGLKMEVSGKMSSIKGTITLTMIKEESRDTKEWITSISIKGEIMIIGRIKTFLRDKDKERSNISIKTGIY